jgi:hypothetical protein
VSGARLRVGGPRHPKEKETIYRIDHEHGAEGVPYTGWRCGGEELAEHDQRANAQGERRNGITEHL